MELVAKTADEVAKMSAQERVAYIQEARNRVHAKQVLPDEIYATVMALLRFERKVSAESSPVGRKKAANRATAAQPSLTIDDL